MKGSPEAKGALTGLAVATWKNAERFLTTGIDWYQAAEWAESIVLSVICASLGFFVTRFWKQRFPERKPKP